MTSIGTLAMLCVGLTAAACSRAADDVRMNDDSYGVIGTSGAADLDADAERDVVPASSLTDAQFARLRERLMGTWRVNPDKSTYFLGPPPQPPAGFIYSRADNNGVRYTTGAGSTVQYYDGRPYPIPVAGVSVPSTVSRAPMDEFTVENLVTRGGKRSARTTHIVSVDGTVLMSITRQINDRGEEVPASFQTYEKVPDGTSVWAEQPKK